MLKRLTLALIVACASAIAFAAPRESWVGMYLQKTKIGYTGTTVRELPNGQTETSTTSVIRTGMLGSALNMEMKSRSLSGKDGGLLRLEFVMTSAGRTLKVEADVKGSEISAKSESGGQTTRRTITIPAGSRLMDESWSATSDEGLKKPGDRIEYLIFDPNSLSLVKTTAIHRGKSTITVRDKTVEATRIEVVDPRAPTNMFLDATGEMIMATGPMGLQMLPETKEVAMKLDGDAGAVTDIADASSFRLSRPLTSAELRNGVRFGVGTSAGTRMLPSDDSQTVEGGGNGYFVRTRPQDPAKNRGSQKVGQPGAMAQWTKPEIRVPSDDSGIRSLAQRIIGSETSAIAAAEKVRRHVFNEIRANPGIGVMRDAKEILKTKEGVCRDHAVVMAALLRSAEIPTKLVSGLVHDSGRLYYHAWVEVWNGAKWIGIDSTRPGAGLTGGHIKIASGSVEDAFVSFLIEGAVIDVRPDPS